MHELKLILSQIPEGEIFYEFDISDKPLSTILQVDLKQLIGIFTSEASDSGYFVVQLAKYIGKLPAERILLYVCSDCGDIACGALSAKIEFTESTVIWSDFAYENSVGIIENYHQIGPFQFDKSTYLNQFQILIKD
jgi:hypothetical protein